MLKLSLIPILVIILLGQPNSVHARDGLLTCNGRQTKSENSYDFPRMTAYIPTDNYYQSEIITPTFISTAIKAQFGLDDIGIQSNNVGNGVPMGHSDSLKRACPTCTLEVHFRPDCYLSVEDTGDSLSIKPEKARCSTEGCYIPSPFTYIFGPGPADHKVFQGGVVSERFNGHICFDTNGWGGGNYYTRIAGRDCLRGYIGPPTPIVETIALRRLLEENVLALSTYTLEFLDQKNNRYSLTEVMTVQGQVQALNAVSEDATPIHVPEKSTTIPTATLVYEDIEDELFKGIWKPMVIISFSLSIIMVLAVAGHALSSGIVIRRLRYHVSEKDREQI